LPKYGIALVHATPSPVLSDTVWAEIILSQQSRRFPAVTFDANVIVPLVTAGVMTGVGAWTKDATP